MVAIELPPYDPDVVRRRLFDEHRIEVPCLEHGGRSLLRLLADVETTTTKSAAMSLGLPTTTTRRVLEDLAAHWLVQREEGDDGRSDSWRLTAWGRDKYRESTVPEKSVGQCLTLPGSTNDDFSGTMR